MPWFRGSILWTFFPIQLSLSLSLSRSLSRSRARSVGNNLLVVMYSSCMQVPIRRSVLKRGFMYIRMHLKNSANACGEKSISKIFGCLVRRLATPSSADEAAARRGARELRARPPAGRRPSPGPRRRACRRTYFGFPGMELVQLQVTERPP